MVEVVDYGRKEVVMAMETMLLLMGQTGCTCCLVTSWVKIQIGGNRARPIYTWLCLPIYTLLKWSCHIDLLRDYRPIPVVFIDFIRQTMLLYIHISHLRIQTAFACVSGHACNIEATASVPALVLALPLALAQAPPASPSPSTVPGNVLYIALLS